MKQNYSLRVGKHRRKRPNKWQRIVEENEFDCIRRAHHLGIMKRINAQIFTVEEELVQMIVLAANYSDYKIRMNRHLNLEGKQDGSSTDELDELLGELEGSRIQTTSGIEGY